MGACCCGCFKGITGGSSNDGSNGGSGETEMGSVNKNFQSASNSKLSVSRTMTAPSIHITKCGSKITGHGLALAGSIIEQDSAYWEWHILKVGDEEPCTISCGVATKKDRSFHRQQQEKQKLQQNGAAEEGGDGEESSSSSSAPNNGREYMKEIAVKKDDTIGVCVQQSDLPMIQFMLNGELLHDLAINRFRGTVYPALYIPQSSSSEQQEEDPSTKQPQEGNVKIQLVMNESQFRELSPGPKFGPVIIARGLV